MGDKETAYHQAGHCLIGYLKGQAFNWVTIVSTDEYFGKVDWTVNAGSEIGIAKVFGGGIAEAILRRDPTIVCARSREILGRTEYERAHNMDGDWPAIFDCVLKTLRKHWDAVEALATALLERKRLEGPEAESILKENLETE